MGFGEDEHKMPPLRATLLIREMQLGFTGDDDELAILEILEHTSNEDLKLIFTTIAAHDLNSDFQGKEWTRLQDFYRRRFKGGMASLLKGLVEPMGEPLPLGVRRGEIPQQKISADGDRKTDQTADKADEARCDVKHPENCPTYETWLHQFGRPHVRRQLGTQEVIGEKAAPQGNGHRHHEESGRAASGVGAETGERRVPIVPADGSLH